MSKSYGLILQAIDQLLDDAEDDLSRAALDPNAALRAKCATLAKALRVTLIALDCHGQKEKYIQEVAKHLGTFVQLKEIWKESDQEGS